MHKSATTLKTLRKCIANHKTLCIICLMRNTKTSGSLFTQDRKVRFGVLEKNFRINIFTSQAVTVSLGKVLSEWLRVDPKPEAKSKLTGKGGRTHASNIITKSQSTRQIPQVSGKGASFL